MPCLFSRRMNGINWNPKWSCSSNRNMEKRYMVCLMERSDFILRKIEILETKLLVYLPVYLPIYRSIDWSLYHLSIKWEEKAYLIDRTKKNRRKLSCCWLGGSLELKIKQTKTKTKIEKPRKQQNKRKTTKQRGDLRCLIDSSRGTKTPEIYNKDSFLSC